MADLLRELRAIEEEARAAIAAAASREELEATRIKYLGRKGRLTQILRSVGGLPPEERPALGQEANRIKEALAEALAGRQGRLEDRQRAVVEGLDVTLPGRRCWLGRPHPLTLVIEEIVQVFSRMGFSVVRGPESETEYYNFDALNIPSGHPARDEMDTFYLPGGILLRTHTSPVQVRTMSQASPPIRIIVPGRCFRRDTIDATHYPIFHQVEGLYVDGEVSLGDLKSTLETFAAGLFGQGTPVRFRPSYYPFVEPGADVDVGCVLCHGEGCGVCKGTGWLEILGAGMVHPAVFETVGYDPDEVTGFAFGMGIERIAMLKYRIPDIRLFYENDLRFLHQF